MADILGNDYLITLIPA